MGSRTKLTDRDTIVLADFDNKTGDPVFDDTLRQGLSVELQQSPFLSLIADQRIQQTLGLMGQPKDARLTLEIASKSAREPGARQFWKAQLRAWERNMCWACARGIAIRGASGSRADPGSSAGGCPQLSQPDRPQITNQGGRIACYRGKALQAARRGYDTLTRSILRLTAPP